MTKVIIQKTKSGDYKSFTCTCHAGYAEEGEDIICAAISVLVINTVNCLDELLHEKIRVEADEKEGGYLSCTFLQKPGDKAAFLIDCMIFGLKSVREEYGKKYLQYVIKEV